MRCVSLPLQELSYRGHLKYVTDNLVKLLLDYDSDSWNRKCKSKYRQTSNISQTSAGYEIVACRRCSNYMFILDLAPGFNKLDKGNYKTRQKHVDFGIWCVLY